MTKVSLPAAAQGVESLQHTLHHQNCPACAAALALASAEKKMASCSLSAAAALWLSGKIARRLRPKTLECCQGHIRALLLFFGDMPLADFHAGSLRAYQLARSAGTGCFARDGIPRPAGPSAVNHELNALGQILRRAGLWDHIRDYYAPLAEPEWTGPKTFSQTEQQVLFDSAALDPNLELADIVFRITRNTTASGCELRGLRLRNIDLAASPPRIAIPADATKNTVRPRTIPLNHEGLEAVQRALDRAHRLGAWQPRHYLFPFRVNRALWDPNRPASKSWLRKQTAALRERTGIAHLRPHAFRHLAVTELLESGVPEQAVISVAGWVSRKMIERYSHTRMEFKAEAVAVLDRKQPGSVPPSSKVIQFRPRA